MITNYNRFKETSMRKLLNISWVLLATVCCQITYAQSTLSFKQAIQMAYRNNPELQAQIAQAKVAKGQVIQSYRYLNPSLTFLSENIGGSGSYSGFESAETTLFVTQPIPLGGKWQYQQKVAEARYVAMQAAIARKQSQLFIQVGKAYIDVIYAKQWYQTTGKLVKLNQDIVNDVEKKIHSGASKKLDLEFAKIDLINENIFQMKALRQLKSARGKLAQLLGQAPETRYTLENHSLPHQLISWPIIKTRLQNSIFLQEKRLLAEANRIAITSTKRNVWPNLALQLGARHFSDDNSNALVVQATSNIPIFNRNQGNIVSAEANYTESLKDLHLEKLSLEQRLYSLYLEAKQRSKEANLVKTKTLPMAKSAQKLAVIGYQKGLHTFADLTLAMRRLINEQRHYIEAHADLERANVTIHGLLLNTTK